MSPAVPQRAKPYIAEAVAGAGYSDISTLVSLIANYVLDGDAFGVITKHVRVYGGIKVS